MSIKRKLVIHIFLAVSGIIMTIPFMWMILTSFKSFGEVMHIPMIFFPSRLRWENYIEVFTKMPFYDFYKNTIITTIVKVAAQLLFCSLAAYSFARIHYHGKKIIFMLTLSVMMIPSQVYLIPQFLIMSRLGWLNTLQALFAPGLVSAFGIFLLRQFFMSMPQELEDSARIDGCNHFMIYQRIMLPLVGPALISLAIFVTLWTWNDLMWPLIVNNSVNKMMLTSGLALMLFGEHGTDYNILMAGAAVGTIPVLILFIFLQKYYVSGIKLTGLKS